MLAIDKIYCKPLNDRLLVLFDAFICCIFECGQWCPLSKDSIMTDIATLFSNLEWDYRPEITLCKAPRFVFLTFSHRTRCDMIIYRYRYFDNAEYRELSKFTPKQLFSFMLEQDVQPRGFTQAEGWAYIKHMIKPFSQG